MSDAIEEKWPKSLVGCIIFLFVMILMLATVIPNDMIDRAMEKEHSMGQALLMEGEFNRLIETTNRLYVAAIHDSGLKAGISDMFMPRGRRTVDAFEEKTSWWFDYLEQRGEALQRISYQIIYRLVLTAYWLPFFAVVAVPALIAGYMRWNAKRYGFDYASPFINNNALNTLSWGLVIMLVGLFFPAPLPPLVVCTILIAIMPTVISLLISNLPKRI